jgi:hypothetical protein
VDEEQTDFQTPAGPGSLCKTLDAADDDIGAEPAPIKLHVLNRAIRRDREGQHIKSLGTFPMKERCSRPSRSADKV